MGKAQTWTARRTAIMDRVHARLASRAQPATGFVSTPEPRSIGLVARGRQLVAGNFLIGGELIEAPDLSIWDLGKGQPGKDQPALPDPAAVVRLQGCAWLDDLAAVGDAKARARAQAWVMDWIARYDRGQGPGWTPDLTGRRLIRWISHALFLLRGQDRENSARFYRSLSRQTIFLSRRWRSAAAGLPRFEAVTGMIHAGLSLTGMESHVNAAVAALARDCTTQVDLDGGIPTRNPEELLEVFTLLVWAAQALTESGRTPPEPHLAAIARIAPTLRALRHSDGGLARFHGGGRGMEGRLDQALASSGVKPRAEGRLSMGFARMTGGRTTVIVDAASPPSGSISAEAHASTLAFELTSGRRPLIVNCGSGASFGPDWRRAGRATASHSTLGIAGYSSSRFGRGEATNREWLHEVPLKVICQHSRLADGLRLELAHDGWTRTHGLTHARILDLTQDGRALAGEDLLTTLDPVDQGRFDRALDESGLQGIPFTLRFHLHPEAEPSLDLGGAAVSITLKSGEVWVFRQDGRAEMTLEPSVYLENGRLRPRPTHQVVLSGRAMSYATRVCWSLSKAQDTPAGLRDLVEDRRDGGADRQDERNEGPAPR